MNRQDTENTMATALSPATSRPGRLRGWVGRLGRVLGGTALAGLLTLLVMLACVSTASVAAAAIAQRGTATSGTTTNTSLTINKPTGVVQGDVMIVDIAQIGNNTTDPSLSGWTLIAGADLAGTTLRRGAVLYKVAGASEPASYTFTLGAGVTDAVGTIVAFSGVDTTGGSGVGGSGSGPFDATTGAISVQPSQTAVAATTITTADANAAVIMFGMAANGTPTWSGWTTTSPGALTEIADFQSTSDSVGAAWATKATAGATGAGAATLSAATRNGGILIALKPQVGPTATPTITQTPTITPTPTTTNTPNPATPCAAATTIPAAGGAEAGYSEYYIPGNEDNMGLVLCSHGYPTYACPSGYHMHTVISVTAWSDNTTVYYDHWENGYNFDPANPATADETYTLNTGQYLAFESGNIALPRTGNPPATTCTNYHNGTLWGTNPSTTCYDGSDHIYVAGGAVTVTRVSWVEERGEGVQGTAWEVYPVKPQLTKYIVPFGETINTGNWYGFQRVATLIQATQNSTTVTVDLNGDGNPDTLYNQSGVSLGTSVTLQAGQTFLLNDTGAGVAAGNLVAGAVIQGSATLQVKYIAGRTDVNYCTRGFSAFPRGYWTTDYYAPLDQPTNGATNGYTDYFLYNPQSSAITINWQSPSSSGSFSIPACTTGNRTQCTVSFRDTVGAVPVGSGLYFKGSDVFWGVGVNDATGYAHEWGYSLLPSTLLYKQHFMGWAPDCDPSAAGCATDGGAFLTVAQDNTTVFVDLNDDGVAEQTYTLNRLQRQFIDDPNDGDLSGARVYATGPFSMAYGQNSNAGVTAAPALDLGYVSIPATDFTSLVLGVSKSVCPQVVPTASGSSATFTITVNSEKYTVDGVTVTDTLPPNWAYVGGTTNIIRPDGSTLIGGAADPTITGAGTSANPYVLTWSSTQVGGNMSTNQQITIAFTAQTTAALATGTLSQNNVEAVGTRTVGTVTQTFTATDFAYVVSGNVLITKSSSVPAATPLYPGDTFTYTTTVTNPAGSGATLTNVSVYDPLPSGLSFVSGSVVVTPSAAYTDNFGAAAYNNQDGLLLWTSNWTETGDTPNGSATTGSINANTTVTGQLYMQGSGTTARYITRTADLSFAAAGSVTLSYRATTTHVTGTDNFNIQYSTDGGTTWTTSRTLTGTSGPANYTDNINLTAYPNNFQIRFYLATGNFSDANESVSVDNVSLSLTPAGLPELLSNAQLAPGASVQIAFNVTVNNPLPTGLTSITNTASTTSTQLPLPISASVTNIVANPGAQSASVSGTVWLDANGNATIDVGETGLANIEVTLKDQYGTPIAVTTTDSQGNYLFTNVTPGSGYYTEVTGGLPSGLSQTAPSGHTDNRSNAFNLTAGGNVTDINLGYRSTSGTATIGDTVWSDANSNGVQDPGEPGVGGVTVRLYLDNGDNVLNPLVDTFVANPTAGPGSVAVTNGSTAVVGTNTKFTSLGAGNPITIGGVSYTIASVTDDTHLTLTANYAGSTASPLAYTVTSAAGPGTVSATNGSAAVVGSGTTFTNLAVGDPIVIKGVRYRVQSVTDDTHLTLTANYTGTTASGLTYGIAVPTTTASDGNYLFTGVAASGTQTYFAYVYPSQSALSNYNLTTPNAFIFQNVASGGAYLTGDFGLVQKASGTTHTITDRLWLDNGAGGGTAGNGTQDGTEAGIAGVTVDLLDNGGNVIATTTSDASGNVTFTGVANGTYQLRVTDRANKLGDYYGTTSYAQNALRTGIIVNGANVSNTSFGYNVSRAIGGTVFNDLNANGVDNSEPAISGVTVKLYNDVNGNGVINTGDTLVGTLTTDASGNYLFTGLANGNYIVSIESPPSGYTYTATGQPADSDSGTAGQQRAVSISGGVSSLSNNFGYWATTSYSISGTLWNDLNANGVDNSEPGFANVTLQLLQGGVVIGTATTDANGNYSFSGLPAGTYTVKVTDSNGVLVGYNITYENTSPYTGQETVTLGPNSVRNFGFNKPQPTLASIGEFSARVEHGQVMVEWETAAEIGTVGFYLERLNPLLRVFERITPSMLPALITSPQGGTYEYADPGARPDESATYRLIEIEAWGTQRVHGPYTVSPKASAPTRVAAAALVAGESPVGQGHDDPRRGYRAIPHALKAKMKPSSNGLLGLATQAPASVNHALWVAVTPSGAAQVKVREDGLYLVSSSNLAKALNASEATVRSWIAQGRIKLSNAGQTVAWTAAQGNVGILFYGQAIDSLYTLDNVYRVEAVAGNKMVTSVGTPSASQPAGVFTETLKFEQDNYPPATVVATDPESDYWFWQAFVGDWPGWSSKTFTLEVPDVMGGGSLAVGFSGGAATDHPVEIWLNGEPLGDGDWSGLGAYVLTLPVDDSALLSGANTVEVRALGTSDNQFFLDRFQLTYQRRTHAVGDRLTLRAAKSGPVAVDGFSVPAISVFDITNPQLPLSLSGTKIVSTGGGYSVTFQAKKGSRYLAVAATAILTGTAQAESGTNLKGQDRVDYAVITTASLAGAAQALADYRTSTSLKTRVVLVDDIYNNFNFGIANPHALGDFLRQAARSWGLRYAVLAGVGTFDYRNLTGKVAGQVPTLMTATPFGLYACDGCLGDFNGDGVPDLVVSRIPAGSGADLQTYLAKLKTYEQGKTTLGAAGVLMLADVNDPSAGDFPWESDQVAALLPPAVAVEPVYLSVYDLATARTLMFGRLEGDLGWLNYIGHGGIDRITSGGLMTLDDVGGLHSTGMLPVVSALTCAVNRFEIPGYASLGEELVLQPGGGAIAVWAPTGLSLDADAVQLDESLFKGVFRSKAPVLGDALRRSLQDNSGIPPFMLRIYNLLGDGALRLRH